MTTKGTMVRRWGTGLAAAVLVAACSIPPEMMGEQLASPAAVQELPPPGFGTLRQEEVSISLTSGDLRLMVTPLAESVTLVTAPDTYQRLSSLAASYGASAGTPHLFLVSFFSEYPDARFVPEEVQLLSRGVRVRPANITAITPTWGERRVGQRETEMAIYSFEGTVDLESEITLVYGLDQTAVWSVIRTRIQAERTRAHVRSRGNS